MNSPAEPPVEVLSLQQFSKVILEDLADPYQTMRNTWIFRGQADSTWPLEPQLLRAEFNRWRSWHPRTTIRDHEQQLVEAFRRASVAYVTLVPADDWGWLALAQHHGLATRLLDWTFNPQVALYFAIGSPFTDGDSAVWCYRHEGASYDEIKDPFKSSEIVFFEPRHVSPRIATQSGCFTSHPVEANEQPWRGQLRQLVIPQKVRAQLRRELFRFGVHEQSMFPHLDGVSRHVNWRYSTFLDEQSLHRPGLTTR